MPSSKLSKTWHINKVLKAISSSTETASSTMMLIGLQEWIMMMILMSSKMKMKNRTTKKTKTRTNSNNMKNAGNNSNTSILKRSKTS
jgi:hypothetical protein